MLRRLIPALAVALLALPVALAEEKAASFKDTEKEFLEKVKEAKAPDERAEVLKTYSARFLALAEKDPKSDEAVEALFYVIRMGQPDVAKAFAKLGDHVDHPKMKQILRAAERSDEAPAMALLEKVMTSAKDKKMQATACKALMAAHERAAQMGERIKDNDMLRERLEKFRGKNTVEKLVAGIDDNKKASEKFGKLLEEKYAGVLVVPVVGKAAPEIVSKDLDGKETKLSALKGKVVVLDIWATWCPPCRAMIPHTRELVKTHEGKPFAFVSISADQKKETLEDFVKKTPMPWTHWWEGTGGMVQEWDIQAFPTIFIIDHKGIIRKKFEGANKEVMEETIEALLKDAEKDAKKSS